MNRILAKMEMTTILFSRRRRRLVRSNRQSIANRNSGNADDVVNDNNSAMNSYFLPRLSLYLSLFLSLSLPIFVSRNGWLSCDCTKA